MKVFNIQMNIDQHNPNNNYATAERWIRKAHEEGADVVVLPELWNTAFHMSEKLFELADKDGVRTKQFFSSLSKELHINIVGGSVTVLEDEKIYNRCYVYDREGSQIAEYDKVHLFSFSGEENYFAKGDKVGFFELDGRKCGIIICYDIRFPEWVRLYALSDVEVLFCVSEWPIKRIPHWKALTQTRAIENQLFLVGCNFASLTTKGKFAGESAIFNPWGVNIANHLEEDGLVYGEIDFDKLKEIRTTLNVYQDRRTSLYDISFK